MEAMEVALVGTSGMWAMHRLRVEMLAMEAIVAGLAGTSGIWAMLRLRVEMLAMEATMRAAAVVKMKGGESGGVPVRSRNRRLVTSRTARERRRRLVSQGWPPTGVCSRMETERPRISCTRTLEVSSQLPGYLMGRRQ
jgi:hypothetical protein